MNPIFYVLASIILVTGSQLLFKKGTLLLAAQPAHSGSLFSRITRMVFQKHIVLGLLLNGLAAACWLLALSNLELSFIFPFLSLNYILIPLLATFFFKEKLSRYRLIGIVIICSGIFLIALS